MDSPGSSRSSDDLTGLEDRTLKEGHLKSEVVKDNNAAYNSGIITENMMKEEKLIEKQNAVDAENMRKKMMAEFKAEQEEKCFKRLKLLLSKSSIYAKFMSDKLKKKQEEAQAKQTGKRKRKHDEDAPPARESRQKKLKAAVDNIIDVYQKENMANIEVEESSQPNKRPVLQPALLTGGTMREYQLEGFEWMKQLFENGVNGILADEMGLGKTIQCIAFIAHLVEMGVPGPYFVCGPLSTIPNWEMEFRRFTPHIPTIVYHGHKDDRALMRSRIAKKVKVSDRLATYPVVITSYAVAMLDAGLLRRFHFRVLVIDEAHRIKNFECALVGKLKRYNTVHRLLLTGTPLQNNLTELWSLLNFILPEIFDDLQVFQSWFDVKRIAGGSSEIVAREQEKQIVSTIHQILAPFLLRRTKADVSLDLPPKKEIIVHARLTKLQQNYYAKALDRSIQQFIKKDQGEQFKVIEDGVKRRRTKSKFLGLEDDAVERALAQAKSAQTSPVVKQETGDEEEFEFADVHVQMQNITMLLRKICGHPYLIKYPVDPGTECYVFDESLISTSGKMMLLDVMLSELKSRGHRVLIFSQFVSMLQILEDYCNYRQHSYVNLYGETSLEERQERIVDFNKDDSSIFIFLISTKAGGLGINLASADTVILYDSDWNPQGDLQAQDRCHRIGQTRPVVVYRLISPHTVDQKIMDYAKAKRQLEKVIIQKGRFSSKNSVAKHWKITREEMLELLESRDFNALVESDDGSVISPAELDKILDRSDMM